VGLRSDYIIKMLGPLAGDRNLPVGQLCVLCKI